MSEQSALPQGIARLFIAEKFQVGGALARQLAPDARFLDGYALAGEDGITWCQGHLLELFKPEDYDARYRQWTFGPPNRPVLPIVPSVWRVKPKQGADKQLALIDELVKRAVVIVHAGDPDREGQLIVDEVLEYVGYRGPVRRLRLAALDTRSIARGLTNLRDNAEFAPMGVAARTRARADWVIGMSLSRAFTLASRKPRVPGPRAAETGTLATQLVPGEPVPVIKTVSVGRVQTPTLALVAARERQVESFLAIEHWQVAARLGSGAGAWTASWMAEAGTPSLDDLGRVRERGVAEYVAAELHGATGSVTEFSQQDVEQQPPLPFNLSDLQVECSARFDFSPKRTLMCAQRLYDRSIASYPRTDCRYLPLALRDRAADVVSALVKQLPKLEPFAKLADVARMSQAWDDSKLTAHHAIVPTGEGDLRILKDDERAVYDVIARRYLAQFLAPLRLRLRVIDARIGAFGLRAHGREVMDPGWTVIASESDGLFGSTKPAAALPELAPGTPLTCSDARTVACRTQPPRRYTEGSLIRAMTNIAELVDDPEARKRLREAAGIGTEATRAEIIHELFKKEFLFKSGRWVRISRPGRAIITGLLPYEVAKPEMTASFESGMQAVERGDAAADGMLAGVVDITRQAVDAARRTRFSPFQLQVATRQGSRLPA